MATPRDNRGDDFATRGGDESSSIMSMPEISNNMYDTFQDSTDPCQGIYHLIGIPTSILNGSFPAAKRPQGDLITTNASHFSFSTFSASLGRSSDLHIV